MDNQNNKLSERDLIAINLDEEEIRNIAMEYTKLKHNPDIGSFYKNYLSSKRFIYNELRNLKMMTVEYNSIDENSSIETPQSNQKNL